jgi:hypothetical protein
LKTREKGEWKGMSEDNEPKIRVKDRRMFNLDGSLRTPDPDEAPAAEQPVEAAAAAAGARDNVVPIEGRGRAAEPQATPGPVAPEPEKPAAPPQAEPEPKGQRATESPMFNELVHSLAVQAAMFMGLVRDPLGPRCHRTCAPLAR